MVARVKTLLEPDLGALKRYIRESFVSTGLLITTKDEGIAISVEYIGGNLIDPKGFLAAIAGIPKVIHNKEALRFHLTVSIPEKDYRQVNDLLRLKSLATFNTKKEMVQSYIERGVPKEIKSKNIYARLQAVEGQDIDSWSNLTSWIIAGFKMPEHMELIYSTEQDKFSMTYESLRSLEKRKHWGKSIVEYVVLKPFKPAGYSLEIKI